MKGLQGLLPERGRDVWGNGAYGASRGHRSHAGVDYACMPGTQILAISSGELTKIGFPYSQGSIKETWSDMKKRKFKALKTFRYTQITDETGHDVRYFYTTTHLKIGDKVSAGYLLCTAQNLDDAYPDITPHFHFEVKYKGKHINPHDYLEKILC